MADENKIFLRVEVQDSDKAIATIRNLKGQIVKTKVPVENLNEVLSDMNAQLSVSEKEAGNTISKLRQLRSNVQINSKEYQSLTKAMMSYNKVLDGTGRATGASTSAAMELGRVVSDLPYGIRGVANNLSQFASQMAFSAKATGSLRLAVKDLWKALTGPLGVLLAIQAVIAALDHFSQKKKETKEVSKELNEELKKEIATLEGYQSVMFNASSSVEDMNNAIIAAAASSKTFREAIADSNGSLGENQSILAEVIKKQKAKQNLDEKISKLDTVNERLKDEKRSIEGVEKALDDLKVRHEERMKRAGQSATIIKRNYLEEKSRLEGIISDLKIRKKLQEEIVKLFEPPRKVIKGSVEYYKKRISEEEKIRDQVSTTNSKYLEQTEIIKALKKELEAITGKKGKDNKISPFKTPKELEIDLKNNQNSIIQMNKKIEQARITEKMNEELAEAKTEEEKKRIREKYAVQRLKSQIDAERKMLKLRMATEKEMIKTKTKNHIDDLRRATDLYIHKVKLDKNLTDKQKAQAIRVAESQFTNAKAQATGEEVEAYEELREKYQPLFKLFEELGIARMDALMSGFGISKDNKDDFSFEDGLKSFMELTAAATDFMNSEFDRQITIEQNKTNALNNELNQRLLNENLSKEERKRIQLEIGANDEKLRKTQEKIEKKRFKMNKAANIAQATISTYLAAADVLANEKLGAIGKIAMMSVVIGAGLAQVAAIARTKFQSSAGSGGQIGGGFGGSEGGRDRSFNFNLAGASRENQLAQTLQGRFDQPIQTYVVSRDITNSQQLDEDIRNNASFG